MKKNILTLFLAVMATTGLYAQQIAVVSKTGATSVCQTLQKAIEESSPESTIYLPGGGFQIHDTVKIDKKLTIVGVSHRGDTDNADGATTISGHLQFIGEASGSAVMGVYVSGNICVNDGVENVTVRFCNANSIQAVESANDLYVNQCYLRNTSNFGKCNV